MIICRRARIEGHIDDPFTRRKTQPVLSVAKVKVTRLNLRKNDAKKFCVSAVFKLKISRTNLTMERR